MRFVYAQADLERLAQILSELEYSEDIDFYDRLREFRDNCLESSIIAQALATLPIATHSFEEEMHRKRDLFPAGSIGYALRWDAINRIVDGDKGVYDQAREQTHVPGRDYEDARRGIVRIFVHPLFNFISNRIARDSIFLYILLRFKRWAEWFGAEDLRNVYEREGEEGLDRRLRQFLFESGVDYPFSQPASPGGKVDIVAGLETDDPLVVEIKIWNSEQSYRENRIRDGLRQAMDYASRYGKDVGHVVVFNLDIEPLVFVSSSNAGEWPARIEYGGATYFFIAVEIAEFIDPVSVRGKGKPVAVNQVDLVDLIASN